MNSCKAEDIKKITDGKQQLTWQTKSRLSSLHQTSPAHKITHHILAFLWEATLKKVKTHHLMLSTPLFDKWYLCGHLKGGISGPWEQFFDSNVVDSGEWTEVWSQHQSHITQYKGEVFHPAQGHLTVYCRCSGGHRRPRPITWCTITSITPLSFILP